VHHELRDDHRDDIIGSLAVQGVEEFQDRLGELPVGRLDDLEVDVRAELRHRARSSSKRWSASPTLSATSRSGCSAFARMTKVSPSGEFLDVSRTNVMPGAEESRVEAGF
jgi:hypothetical protein